MIPAAWLPQMPKACTSWSSESLNSRAAAAAAAKLPVIAVGWKCRACSAPGTASPTRHMTSTAAGTSPSESASTKRARRRAAVGAGTVTSIYRAASRLSIPAQPPDLLGRPAVRPRRRHVRMTRGGAGGRAQLEQVEDLQAAGAKQADPLARGQRELDRLVVGPLQPMETEVVAAQVGVGGAGAVGGAQRQQRSVLEEDQLAARPQQPRRLRDPPVGIAPDAGAVLRQH